MSLPGISVFPGYAAYHISASIGILAFISHDSSALPFQK